MGGAAGPGGPPRRTGDQPRATLSGWSLVAPYRVTWSDPAGRILSYAPDAGKYDRSRVQAEFALPLAAAAGDPDLLLTISLVPRPKADGPARDLTEIAARDAAGVVVPHPGFGNTIRPERLMTPALAPDGKRLALVEGKADPETGTRHWRTVVYNLENGAELCSSPKAARYAGVCWIPDGKALVYARSQVPRGPTGSPARRRTPAISIDLIWRRGKRRVSVAAAASPRQASPGTASCSS